MPRTLTTLPPEIINLITTHLPPLTALALRTTHPLFHAAIPLPSNNRLLHNYADHIMRCEYKSLTLYKSLSRHRQFRPSPPTLRVRPKKTNNWNKSAPPKANWMDSRYDGRKPNWMSNPSSALPNLITARVLRQTWPHGEMPALLCGECRVVRAGKRFRGIESLRWVAGEDSSEERLSRQVWDFGRAVCTDCQGRRMKMSEEEEARKGFGRWAKRYEKRKWDIIYEQWRQMA
ncbi:hypothetical protein BT63DRAFT_413235 [Microthyrium microscopicum]|uniref:F-box domain-containing protein n=1 Tax=Microthyrium microscopicum TaxID=703497 RepID=A0A6A6UHF0_9PEZI|nr:hypothetical protein BT63DRAFT_413235 [Microthyrium microscopicum]